MKSPQRSPVAGARGRPYDRHSASGTRGLPKKKGAGGKGVWGAALDQAGDAPVDRNDPNYDSEEEGEGAEVQVPELELQAPAVEVVEVDSESSSPPTSS